MQTEIYKVEPLINNSFVSTIIELIEYKTYKKKSRCIGYIIGNWEVENN